MRRFSLVVAVYILACCIGVIAIVLHGDGPHPRVIAIYPPNGDRYWPGGLVEITFSQAMNEGSVERALGVSPAGQGQGSWYGNTLNLEPSTGWSSNVTYHVSLTGSVMDAEDRPLHTPVSFWFRVHVPHHLVRCTFHGLQQVCERLGPRLRLIFHSPASVQQFALSEDGTMIAYTRRDGSGLPHLFLINTDGSGNTQLTRGRQYADSNPYWPPGDTSSITYTRRRVTWRNNHPSYGYSHLWNIETDGTLNARI